MEIESLKIDVSAPRGWTLSEWKAFIAERNKDAPTCLDCKGTGKWRMRITLPDRTEYSDTTCPTCYGCGRAREAILPFINLKSDYP